MQISVGGQQRLAPIPFTMDKKLASLISPQYYILMHSTLSQGWIYQVTHLLNKSRDSDLQKYWIRNKGVFTFAGHASCGVDSGLNQDLRT